MSCHPFIPRKVVSTLPSLLFQNLYSSELTVPVSYPASHWWNTPQSQLVRTQQSFRHILQLYQSLRTVFLPAPISNFKIMQNAAKTYYDYTIIILHCLHRKTNFTLVACHTRFCLYFHVYTSIVKSCIKGLEVRARFQTLTPLYVYHCQPVSRDWYWWHCSRSACWTGHVTVYCSCHLFCTSVEKSSSLKRIIKICHLYHSVLTTCWGVSKLELVFMAP